MMKNDYRMDRCDSFLVNKLGKKRTSEGGNPRTPSEVTQIRHSLQNRELIHGE